jgi:4-hydroxy-tetrahydrodipicolinate synthase
MSKHMNEQTKGVFVISATPFTEDGAIDYASVDRLMETYIRHGVSGVTILGMMGEAAKMSGDESEKLMRHMIARVDGRVPVLVGVSDAGMANLERLSKSSMDAGACGIMVAPVSGLNTEEKLYNYFAQVFAALGSEIPVCYQDYPQTTGVHISVACLNRMINDFPQLVMFKHEDCPGLSKLSGIRRASESEGVRRVSILVGNGGLYLPQEMMRGADGAMTGFAFPELLVDVVRLFEQDQPTEAEDLFDAYLPLIRYEQQIGYGLAVRKEVLRRRGTIACAATRAPGPKMNARDHEELTAIMERVERRLRDMGRDMGKDMGQ